jgi:putative endonuclease
MLEAYWIYILKCSDGSLYTGCTSSLTRRLRAHLSGKASKYTRSRLPVTLAYAEKAVDKGGALRREAQIKRLTRSEKLFLCRAFEAKEKHSTH